MSLEPLLPFEFVVHGVARSLQNKGRRSLDDWKAIVQNGYSHQLVEGHWAFEGALAVTIFYFPVGVMQGDLDNIIKPVLDAMTGGLYLNDRQIERLLVRKFEPHRMLTFVNPTASLLSAAEAARPVLYVRLDGEAMLGAEGF